MSAMAVLRREGANHQWRKIPPAEFLVDRRPAASSVCAAIASPGAVCHCAGNPFGVRVR